jgi:hypothetical protein
VGSDFDVQFEYVDREKGPGAGTSIKVQAASSFPVAIAKATREFWKGRSRKERFDSGAGGLRISATRIESESDNSEKK